MAPDVAWNRSPRFNCFSEAFMLLCCLYLYLAAAGGGEWALDRVLARRPS